jgi:WD40 repeat protein
LRSFTATVFDYGDFVAGAVLAAIPLETYGCSVRMSPTDPAVVFVGGLGGLLLMCNTTTGSRTKLQGYTSSVWGLCVSEDGRSLASSSDDSTVTLWDTATGRCLWTSSSSVRSVAMHGDMVFCGVSNSNTVGLRKSDGTTGMTFAAKASSVVLGLAVTRGEGRVCCAARGFGKVGSAHVLPLLPFVFGARR